MDPAFFVSSSKLPMLTVSYNATNSSISDNMERHNISKNPLDDYTFPKDPFEYQFIPDNTTVLKLPREVNFFSFPLLPIYHL